MKLPFPIPGLVIRYAYLWHAEFTKGRTLGTKDRPCVVVLAVTRQAGGEVMVSVAPITHAAPGNPNSAIKLTPATQRRLGLDQAQCWIMATEINQFKWPGPDIAPTPAGNYAYGELPAAVFLALKEKILSGPVPGVARTD